MINYKEAIDNIRTILQDYIEDSNLKSLVLGVSGGIDSTLCALLAKPVCDYLHIPLIGRSITIESNKKDEIERANGVGMLFCTDFQEIDLTELYRSIRNELIGYPSSDPSHDYKVQAGNLKARTRMMKLYALSGQNKGMVLSTDNYTELLAGFWTLHGDVGDFGMIQNLWKTEVYEMAAYIAKHEIPEGDINEDVIRHVIQSCISANPTDGLGITNSDLDQLGVKSYEEADEIFKQFLQDVDNRDKNGIPIKNRNHPIIKRYYATNFKRNNPYNIPRNEITDVPFK